LALIVCVALGITGCGAGSSLRTWHGLARKVFPDDQPGTKELADRTRLVARNGHVSVQIALRSEKAIPQLSVEVKAPERAGQKLTAQARWVDYVPVGSNPPGTPLDEVIRPAPGLFPDPLMEKWPFELKAATTQPVWITVYAPAEAAPATTGANHVPLGGQRLKSVGFTVRVTTATVPAEQKLKVTNWFTFGGRLHNHFKVEPYSEKYWRFSHFAQVLADHKQNVIRTPVLSLATVRERRSAPLTISPCSTDGWRPFRKPGSSAPLREAPPLPQRGYFAPVVVLAYVNEGGKLVEKVSIRTIPAQNSSSIPSCPLCARTSRRRAWRTATSSTCWTSRTTVRRRLQPLREIVKKHLPGIPTIDAVGLDQDVRLLRRCLRHLGAGTQQLRPSACETARPRRQEAARPGTTPASARRGAI
jgi:hypothetical protein